MKLPPRIHTLIGTRYGPVFQSGFRRARRAFGCRGSLARDRLSRAPGAFLELSSGVLHYRWDGPANGPIVVMVHGFSTPHFIFEQNMATLVSAGYRVLRFDHFGRGWSDRPRVDYDADFYDAMLLELLDRLNIHTPVGLVGLSMGGLIAAEFAARHPERINRVMLLCPAGLAMSGPGPGLARLLRLPILGSSLWHLIYRRLLINDPEMDFRGVPRAARLAGDLTMQFSYRGYGNALLTTLRNFPMADQDEVFGRLGATGLPVCAVFGRRDTTVLIASADRLSALVPDAKIMSLDAGHGLNYRHYNDVAPILLDWFAPAPGHASSVGAA